ncbi:MAG: SDR family oxidoreductase [Polyangiaceae bacterium]|nr:SDR family oxidoreductase [Polyangiaceae bacterium]
MSEKRRVALVTGASSGIGVDIARRLALEGFDVVLVARRKNRLVELADRIEKEQRVKAYAVEADLSSLDGAKRLVTDVAAQGLELDCLVNNAGFGVYGKMVDADIDRTLEMVELNVVSLTYLTHHYVKEMVARGRGYILQTASIGAFQPSPFYAVYSATKAYVLSFSEALHHELQGTGVSITTSCPGLTATEFHDVAVHQKPDWMKPVTMTAEEVARISVQAMLRGERTTVPGFSNWMTSVAAQILPKSVIIPIAAATMKSG